MTLTLPTTYETYDLVTMAPESRVSVRSMTQSDGQLGPQFSRPIAPRQLRRYVITLRPAYTAEIRRAYDIWNRARFGTLPVLFTHPKDGQLAVVVLEPEFTWRQDSARFGQLEQTLEEWPS